uniref:ATP synthase complex subunit 8 n=2 Tax=Hesperiidae TaxID=40093 RepID=A0A075E664_LOBBI|nr:ATP synthase F0 subunit 8 [Lobocla bifasciata]YP_009050430.1 ATP synthase F0 subunit 8 [Potanthus flavus]AIC37412.1 ATP synthase F0 subunit 8 [Lobocla bifasciata]AIC37425.1 ATP synthase F0 subunit 8 [Potanthus flavus]
MPQMMPINWIISFILFISIFIMFNILNYYIFFNINNKNKKKIFNQKKIIWKW